MVWYDKHRKCQDGTMHEGKLELITWEGNAGDGEVLGWGAVFKGEANELKERFEDEFDGDEARFFAYWPQGFRWTCCGCTADMDYGCDHHGAGSKPCTCDFCHMGKPLPDALYMMNKQATRGLTLRRGPDPRSFNPARAQLSEMMRGLMGLDSPLGESSQASPFCSVLDSTQHIASYFTHSPAAAAAFADAQRRVNADTGGTGSTGTSSSKGAAAGSSSSGRASSSSSSKGTGKDQTAKSNKTWVCSRCGVRRPVPQMFCCKACKAHQKVPYCSRECQLDDWPKHKAACKQAQQAVAGGKAAAGHTAGGAARSRAH